MSELHYLNFSVKARYFSSGSLSGETECIVLAFHGYGQLGSYFIRNFDTLKNCYVIVPEGLHRFYLKGTEGRVGASWMTKEDRIVDIENQSSYLNAIYNSIKNVKSDKTRLIVLGFSQGVSTALRWLVNNKIKADTFVAWAGSFPLDLEADLIPEVLKETQFIKVIGDKDPYFNKEHRELVQDWINSHSLKATDLSFAGEHRLDKALLESIISNTFGK